MLKIVQSLNLITYATYSYYSTSNNIYYVIPMYINDRCILCIVY